MCCLKREQAIIKSYKKIDENPYDKAAYNNKSMNLDSNRDKIMESSSFAR